MAFNFDQNVFLLHSSVELNHFVVNSWNKLDFTPRCLFVFDDNLNEVEQAFDKRRGTAELLIVCPGSADYENIVNVMSFVKKVYASHVNLKIGIFFPHTVSQFDLQNVFEWSWSQRIINVFVAFRHRPTEASSVSSSLNVFIYNPFGVFDVINVTGSIEKIFPEKISNFQQHRFRIAVIDDDSIVQYSSSVPFFDGPDEMLWKAVFSVVNATYSTFLVNGSLEPIDVLDNGTVDIHGDLTDILNQRIVTIYPMVMEILSVIVPKTKPYSTFEAFMKVLTSSNFVGYSLCMIVVVVLVLTCSRYMDKRKLLIHKCAADVMNLLLNDNTAISYKRMSYSEIVLVVPMTFAGFIIVNGFLSSLKSYITQPIMQPQIETIDEFYRSSLRMTSPNEYWIVKDAEMLNSLLKRPGNFSHKMSVIDYEDFVRNILNEVSFAFAEYNSIARFMCKHKKYYITPIQMQRIWYSHNVRYDFPFIDRFNELIDRITTAGLYDKWWRDATVEDKLFRSVTAETHAEHFSAPVFIVYGWVAGCVVFVVELNWERIKRIVKLHRRFK